MLADRVNDSWSRAPGIPVRGGQVVDVLFHQVETGHASENHSASELSGSVKL